MPTVAMDAAPAIVTADREILARASEEGTDGRHRSVWIRVIPDASDEPPSLLQSRGPRWRYPDLDELLARPSERQPAFHEGIHDADPVVSANTAIALARLGNAAGAEVLFHAIEAPSFPLPMRCAAVEALGSLPGDEPARLLSQLLDQYGDSAEHKGRHVHVPELHAELIAALGHRSGATDDPRLLAALHGRSSDVRLEALRTWANDDAAPLPEALIDLRTSGDVRLRLAVLEMVVAKRHPDAHRLLADAVCDHNLQVRVAAIHGLGTLADADARATLETLLNHHTGRMREATVAALAELKANEAVFRAVGDESWRVRAEVARAMARFNGPDAVAVADTLLDDPSSEVHRELLKAIARWPVKQSGPILLKAMGKESFLCRKTATDQLAAHWPPAASFPVEGPAERRRAEMDRLTAEFRTTFELADEKPVEPAPRRRDRMVTADELSEVERLLEQEDTVALVAIGPVAIEALEVLAIEYQRPVPELMYQDALPKMHLSFALLARMETTDVTERRRGATELAALAEKEPLGRLAVERLCRFVTPEADALVFQSVLAAVAQDESEAAHRIAYAAVGHAAAEVRRRGCLHLAAHPHPKHTPVLLPAVDDEADSVAAAAVQALGACGHAADAGALTELLRVGNDLLQLEAALALVQLDDPSGIAALERLAHSRDAAVRRRVAEKMGELSDPVFTPTLMRLLDDRVSIIRAALAALPRTVGEDKSLSPDGNLPTTTERVRRWKAWFVSR